MAAAGKSADFEYWPSIGPVTVIIVIFLNLVKMFILWVLLGQCVVSLQERELS